jgi:hypothetical protein
MVIITGGTKTITPISWLITLALMAVVLGGLSYVNLSGRNLPTAAVNDRIVADLVNAQAMPTDSRLPQLIELRERQENALAADPAEPFAWARLAWLRLATQGDAPDAFAALRISDLVSPGEPRQLPERALMWRQFADIEDNDQKAYQNVLWQKAFQMQRDATWKIATQNGIVKEVGDSLKQTDPDLYEEWKAREADAAKSP